MFTESFSAYEPKYDDVVIVGATLLSVILILNMRLLEALEFDTVTVNE